MALPPIIGNLPFLRGLQSGTDTSQQQQQSQSAGQSVQTAPQSAQDNVSLSEEALQRLESETAITEIQVNEVVEETRNQLDNNEVTLGLDPEFEA